MDPPRAENSATFFSPTSATGRSFVTSSGFHGRAQSHAGAPFGVISLDDSPEDRAEELAELGSFRSGAGAAVFPPASRGRPSAHDAPSNDSSRSSSVEAIRSPVSHSRLPSHTNSARSHQGSAPHSCAGSRSSSRAPTTPISRHHPRPPRPRVIVHSQPSYHSLGTPINKPTLFWRLWRHVKPWLPLLAYGATSLGFAISILFWKSQVFTGLDHLSSYLKTDGYAGYIILYSLIFVTTIPPIPLYSTLIILSGYTFGAVRGFIVSYLAALTGALAVFFVSRHFFRASISRWFAQFVYLQRVVRAIERRPRLLFLVRLAPYPYNVMNSLLAASPTLSAQTYAACTALSLFKLCIHTTIGSTIHSFSRHYLKTPATGGGSGPAPGNSTMPGDGAAVPIDTAPAVVPEDEPSSLGTISTVVGIVLCVGLFFYLSYVARRAIDDELGDEDGPARDSEEGLAFLAADGGAGEGVRLSLAVERPEMAETPSHPLSAGMGASPRVYVPHEDRFEVSGREEAGVGLRG